MREKLIELFMGAERPVHMPCTLDKEKAQRYIFGEMADHLIANGVTIPVRCKECKYGVIDDDFPDEDFPIQYLCKHHVVGWNDGEHFCAYGKRRNNEGKVD